jgi:S-adenosylmethionine:tRNA ribosyltransferase-isomerase
MSIYGPKVEPMKTSDFLFDLPDELIAQEPSGLRGESRLLVVERSTRRFSDGSIGDLGSCIAPGSVMVFNDSRVRKARIYGHIPESGNEAEFLLVVQEAPRLWKALLPRMKRRRAGTRFVFAEGVEGEVIERADDLTLVEFSAEIDDAYLERNGHVPLPPYIKRSDTSLDSERYQTVFARTGGSIAAPTAGLHFTEELLAGLRAGGIETAFVTLHVGLGTFIPIRSADIENHVMHEEEYSVSDEAARTIEAAKREGRRVIAVGTTSVRTLESAWKDGSLLRGQNRTKLFIKPGYRFEAIDGMLTNFHTPGSTLLVLVSAFAGKELIREAYAEAIKRKYRFFSYGDAMLIL